MALLEYDNAPLGLRQMPRERQPPAASSNDGDVDSGHRLRLLPVWVAEEQSTFMVANESRFRGPRILWLTDIYLIRYIFLARGWRQIKLAYESKGGEVVGD